MKTLIFSCWLRNGFPPVCRQLVILTIWMSGKLSLTIWTGMHVSLVGSQPLRTSRLRLTRTGDIATPIWSVLATLTHPYNQCWTHLQTHPYTCTHRMDSFVLAETFKYLYLLFAEDEDVPLDMNSFVFSTEAHLLPLSLANQNTTLNQMVRSTVSLA